jgi:P4 family phage/plasmid primase-like protien
LLTGIWKLAKSFAPAYLPQVTPEGHIPVADGVIDITSGTPVLKPHSASYGFRNLAPIPWNAPTSECPRFLKALNDALPPDDVSLIQRYAGQCLLGKNLSQTILLIRGTAGGGKSTLVNIIVRLIGEENTSELRTAFLGDRFELSRIVGKTLLLGIDVPSDFLNTQGASKLKPLVGNDSKLSVERKNDNGKYSIQGIFNMLVTANSRLRVKLDGDDKAWERRLLVVDYERPPTKHPIPNFASEVLKTEGTGILHWAVDGAIALLAELAQGALKVTASQRQRTEDLLTESDSITAFVRNGIKQTQKGDITTLEALEGYEDFCDSKGWVPEPGRIFMERFGQAMQTVHNVKRRNDILRGGSQHRGYTRFKIDYTSLPSTTNQTTQVSETEETSRTLRTVSTNLNHNNQNTIPQEKEREISNKDFDSSVRTVRNDNVVESELDQSEDIIEAIPPD